MFFTITLELSLIICSIGLLYRIRSWFVFQIGPQADRFTGGQRVAAAVRGMATALFSRRMLNLGKVLVLDVLLQVKILKASFWRWLMHMSIFAGFLLLLLMHALDEQITRTIFPEYESTLNPFLFLRNLGGALVLAGIVIAIYRRWASWRLKFITRAGDKLALVILAVIIMSGFLLESFQIISAPIFNQMVEDYFGSDDPKEIDALKAYWAEDFAVVFDDSTAAPTSALLAKGRALHEESCAGCHSNPRSAFVSYPLAKAAQINAGLLNRVRADIWLWYVHFLACFSGLALLPFTKFFHLFSTPLRLLLNAVENRGDADPANRETGRAMGLDACTRCGVCSVHCSVAPVVNIIDNLNILPSEKLKAVKALAAGKRFDSETLAFISEGSFICTDCLRCTGLCPAGINLQDIWGASRNNLAEKGFDQPHIWVREKTAAEWAAWLEEYEAISPAAAQIPGAFNLCDKRETFAGCIQCTTCTNVCPVVAATDNPSRDLELTPQQIMNLLRLGLKDMAMGARMVWDCTTCYMCQEHCPNGVKVADVLYELRNMASERFQTIREKEWLITKTRKNDDTKSR
jgi:heterodisulfide reductase subunit C/nitrate reductase gamma subunit